MIYKVWVELEEQDEETGDSDMLDIPFASLRQFETEEEARNFIAFLYADYAEHEDADPPTGVTAPLEPPPAPPPAIDHFL